MFSGHWTLERAGQEVASAQKTTAFGRTFEMQTPMGSLSLSAAYPIGRTFRLERSGNALAMISPVHPFTRRASIQTITKDYDFPIISFSFWLAALTWRRAAAQSSGGG